MCLFKYPEEQKTINMLGINPKNINKINTLYKKTNEYLDFHFIKEIKSGPEKFHQRWVEMLTLYKLLDKGIKPIKPYKKGNQPDIRITICNKKEIWIECASPSPGSCKDLLEKKYNAESAKPVPMNALLSRITAIIQEKTTQHLKHIKAVTDNRLIIPILLVNVGLLDYPIFDEFAGLFQGWKDRGVYLENGSTNDLAQIHTIPCEKFNNPKSGSHIDINYFNNNSPFWAVIYSSDQLGTWTSVPPNRFLPNPHFIKNDIILKDISSVLDAILIDYTQLQI